MVYGGFTSNVDMKSGAPAFGTPENSRANMAGGQLARLYNIPYRTSACSASNAVDAQAVWETQMSLWGAVSGYGNLIYHAAGWGEGGLVASYESWWWIVKCSKRWPPCYSLSNLAQMIWRGGTKTGAARRAFFWRRSYHATLPRGVLCALYLTGAIIRPGRRPAAIAQDRVTDIWQEMLETYEKPGLPIERIEAINDFVARRKEQIGESEISG